MNLLTPPALLLHAIDKLFRRESNRPRRRTVRPLVSFPSFRECPPDLRRELRQIDPRFELVYFGRGEWWLGRVIWTWDRYHAGVKAARTASTFASRPDPGKHKHGLLAMQGFGYIESFWKEPGGDVLRRARELYWQRISGRMDDGWEEAAYLSDDERVTERHEATIRDKAQAEARSDYRIIMKKRHTTS